MIVVDVGCYSHPDHQGSSQDSVTRLIERFRPVALYGFDPHPDLRPVQTVVKGTKVYLERAAAWTHDGNVAVRVDGLATSLTVAALEPGPTEIARCFDLAAWLRRLSFPGAVLKLDCEGAEYALLEHLIGTGADRFLDRLLVEWHDDGRDAWVSDRRRAGILAALTCPVEPWDGP